MTGALYLQGSLLKPKSNVMSKKFQLQIPEPCHEDWNEMTPVQQGRFCDSCQKSVVDFTGMSDMQLIAFFKKPSTGSVCGRFFNDQLERDFEIPRKRIPWLKYFFQFAIPIFLTGFKSYSQGKPIIKESLAPVCVDSTSGKTVIFGNSFSLIRNEILGKVIDEGGKGIPYASVIVKGTTTGISCDSAGNFYLRIPENQKKLILVTSCVGYTSTESVVNFPSLYAQQIILISDKTINGEVVVTSFVRISGKVTVGAYSSIRRRSIAQKVEEIFTKDSINVYPNPAKAGSEIKIEWRKTGSGDYTIDLYNLQGQLIKSTLAKIENETNSFTFQIPAIIPGSYVLRLTNKKTGKKHTEKIIIQ